MLQRHEPFHFSTMQLADDKDWGCQDYWLGHYGRVPGLNAQL